MRQNSADNSIDQFFGTDFQYLEEENIDLTELVSTLAMQAAERDC